MTNHLYYNRHFVINIEDTPGEPFAVTFDDPNECITLVEFDADSLKRFVMQMLAFLPTTDDNGADDE